MQSGQTELAKVAEMPGVFCEYVPLVHSNFLPISISPMKVLLSVLWNKTEHDSPVEAAASWSENVTAHGFKARVLVAGRYLHSNFNNTPFIHWTALNFHEDNSDFFLESGIAKLPTWYTGTLCQSIDVESRLFTNSHRAIVSISHMKPKSYQNVMTVWTELSFSRFKVCARELQNFDGVHEGVLVVSNSTQ